MGEDTNFVITKLGTEIEAEVLLNIYQLIALLLQLQSWSPGQEPTGGEEHISDHYKCHRSTSYAVVSCNPHPPHPGNLGISPEKGGGFPRVSAEFSGIFRAVKNTSGFSSYFKIAQTMVTVTIKSEKCLASPNI